ncbi:trace amine-associated receptor 1-like [Aulostomus maculatus]
MREIFDVALITAFILNLCCISIERYFVVCHPLRYRTTITSNVVVIMILVIWSVSALVAIGFILAELGREQCGEKCYIDILLANISGPTSDHHGLHVKIFLVAQKQARSIQDTTRKSGATVSKNERKATKTLAIVMGFFSHHCFYFQLLNPVTVPLPLSEALIWLALSNSMLNPFIYAFFYSWFRSAFRMIICGKIFITQPPQTVKRGLVPSYHNAQTLMKKFTLVSSMSWAREGPIGKGPATRHRCLPMGPYPRPEYNNPHSRTRSVVERAIGQLKGWWRCLDRNAPLGPAGLEGYPPLFNLVLVLGPGYRLAQLPLVLADDSEPVDGLAQEPARS